MSVRIRARFPVELFLRATILHVGATAIATALREDLTRQGYITDDDFNSAYSAARLTPGTTMLALYVILGHRLAGWRGASMALAAGLIAPAVIVVALTVLYNRYRSVPAITPAIEGARVAVVAVLIGSAINLVRPLLLQHRLRGMVLAAGVLVVGVTTPIPVFAILLVAATTGAFWLR